jgi:hypothetical protein
MSYAPPGAHVALGVGVLVRVFVGVLVDVLVIVAVGVLVMVAVLVCVGVGVFVGVMQVAVSVPINRRPLDTLLVLQENCVNRTTLGPSTPMVAEVPVCASVP